MAAARSPYPTLYEVLSEVHVGRSTKAFATDGLTPKPFPHHEGLLELGPEQLLGVRIPVQRVTDGAVRGYQRHLRPWKAREFAKYLVTAGPNYQKKIGHPEVSVDGEGNAFWTDGQHRAAGAVIARKPLKVIVTRRTEAEARELFANQAKASRVSRNVLILDGGNAIEEYIQDAVTREDHAWSALISTSQSGSAPGRISATSAYNMIRTYTIGSGEGASIPDGVKFDSAAADELATFLRAFGTKKTNPDAYSALGLRAIAMVARRVFRERRPAKDDRERWSRYMPRFNFAAYAYLHHSTELTRQLAKHWNKNLVERRRIPE